MRDPQPHGKDLTDQVIVKLQPGKDYRWVIGTGGSATVYRGEWWQSEAGPPVDVAVKVFRATTDPASEDMENARRRLIRESHAWLHLSHRNVQPYLGHCSQLAPSIALISPFCSYGTITDYIRKKSADNRLRLKLIADIANGLAYLQSRQPVVVHGDLKPSNVLIDDFGNARLADFGRARLVGESGFTTDLFVGSAPYMAPELLPPSEEENLTHLFTRRSDMYAFAMVAYEIFTEEIPFRGLKAKTHGQIMLLVHREVRPLRSSDTQQRISDSMWQTMERCWQNDPAQRPLAAEIIQFITI